MGVESWPWWSQDQHQQLLAASLHMMGEDGEAGGHSGLYHTSSQVLLARLYDNVLTNLTNPPGLRQTCVNCGQMEVEVEVEDTTDTETSDDNEEDRSDFSDSDFSSTSTDITVRLTRNFSHHNILKKSSGESGTLQYSKSLSSLPLRLETGEQSEHARLSRTRG